MEEERKRREQQRHYAEQQREWEERFRQWYEYQNSQRRIIAMIGKLTMDTIMLILIWSSKQI